MKKLLCFILAILFISLPFTACKSNADQTQTPSSSEDGGTQPEENPAPEAPPFEITVAMLTQYKIIRADACGGEIVQAVNSLVTAISDTYGVKLEKGDDFYREGYNTIGEFEIIVGATNREESKSFLENFKYDDYGYEIVGKKLIIAGHSPDTTVKAVEHFKENILKAANETVFFSNESKYTFKKTDYLADTVKLNGVDIAKYTIVYPFSNKNNEKTFATMLQSKIVAMSGFYLNIENDKTSSLERYEIIIGSSQAMSDELKAKAEGVEDGKYLLTSANNTVILASKTNDGMLNAIDSLIEKLTPAEGKRDSDYSLDSGFSADIADKESLSTMSFNVYVGDINSTRISRVISMILTYSPDTFGVQEANSKWMTELTAALPEYAYVGEGRDGGGSNGEYSAVFYKKDKFNLIEGGTKWLSDTPDVKGSKYEDSNCVRIMSYAVLERKADGSRFIHVNTHLDHVSSAAREKQTKVLLDQIAKLPDYPVILTGDFNCNSSSAPYGQITNKFENAANIAEVGKNEPTFHGYAEKSSTIDFIFFKKGTSFIVNFYKVCNEKIDGNYASDHHPVYAEYIMVS